MGLYLPTDRLGVASHSQCREYSPQPRSGESFLGRHIIKLFVSSQLPRLVVE